MSLVVENPAHPEMDDVWAAGIRQVQEASGGVLDIFLIDAKTAAELLRDARRGDAKAARLFGAVVDTGRRIVSAPHRSPMLCAGCPRCLRRVERDLIFGVASPAIDEPTSAIGFAICGACAADRTAWMAKAEAGLRLIWPDLRPIVVTPSLGGRA